jgi:hypothetical protein
MSPPLAAITFAVAAALSLGASAVLVVRLERLGTRLALPGAVLGMVAALAADSPEITSAVTALAHGQHDIGTGVVLGSNVFNLAALTGLGAVAAGGIRLHRRVVVFEGVVALWIAAVSIAATAGLITPAAALVIALAVLAPYVYVSAAHPSGGTSLPIPQRLRSWLAGAVAEEEQELAGAIQAAKGGLPDAAMAALATAVVLAASVAMERSASTLGARYAVPGIITGGIVLAAVSSAQRRRGRLPGPPGTSHGDAQRGFQQQHAQRAGRPAHPRRPHRRRQPRRRAPRRHLVRRADRRHRGPRPGRAGNQPPQRRADHRRLSRFRCHGHRRRCVADGAPSQARRSAARALGRAPLERSLRNGPGSDSRLVIDVAHHR